MGHGTTRGVTYYGIPGSKWFTRKPKGKEPTNG